MRRPLALALLLSLAMACSSTRTLSGDLIFGKTAEEDYASGVQEMKSKNWLEAAKFLERVRTKYPFSRFAPLAELRLADAKFEQDRFVEAADAYAQFVKLHPTHEEVDYGAFRVGFSRWKDGPSEFMLFPPSYEKDLSQVREAAKALGDFVAKYPESKFRPEAEKLAAQARGKLAEHEWYAAEFYAKRDRWPAVVGRLETLVKDFPGSGREPAALLQLAQAYLKLDDRFRAQQALQRLIVKHPQDPRRPEAEKLLAALR
jgi:outer membrane protein assembly factor BamD